MRFRHSILLVTLFGCVIAAPTSKLPDMAFDVVLDEQRSDTKAGDHSRDNLARRDLDATGCTLNEQTEAQEAADVAKSYVEKVERYLAKMPDNGALYRTWFGALSPSRLDTVKSIFSAINTGIREATYICGDFPYNRDEGGAAAPYLFVRGAFWDLPNAGPGSRAGAIVHQLASFEDTPISPTSAYYPEDAAKSVAYWYPDLAIHGPDNYRYFAESVGVARL